MKNRGKSMKTEQDKPKFISNSNNFSSNSSQLCVKHPSSSSSGGICAYCLNEKLIKLVCADCGEQRISPCSCSNSGFSSNRNSSYSTCAVDVGSVGRVSCLIESEAGYNGNEAKTLFSHMKLKQSETEDLVMFKRSSSCVVDVKKSNGFWKIGSFFKKKKEKVRNNNGLDQESDVSRSRSLSSFMGDKFHNEIIACSSAKISDFTSGLMDLEGGFRVKESEFSRMECDDEFIDLEIDVCDNSKTKTEYSVFKKCDLMDLKNGGGGDGGMGVKKVKNNHMKSWKWNFKHHSGNNDHNHILKS